jgi:hypothetical protein
MNPADPDRPGLTPEDERLVLLVAEASRPPALGAARRAAFTAELEQRLARPPRRGWRSALALAVGTAAAALLLFAAGEQPATRRPERVVAEMPSAPEAPAANGVSAEEALLALDGESAAERDESLPEDYVAIESLLLGG